MQVIDNFLSEDEFKTLRTYISSTSFPWYFDREIIGLRGAKRMGPEGGSSAIAISISTYLSEGL